MRHTVMLIVFVIGIVGLFSLLFLYAYYTRGIHSGYFSSVENRSEEVALDERDDLAVPDGDVTIEANEPSMQLTPQSGNYEIVEFSTLEELAGYIKYSTNLEENIPQFIVKAEDYLHDAILLPESLSSDNMVIINLVSSTIYYVIINDFFNYSSTVFSVSPQESLPNRVDKIATLKNVQYSSYKYLSTGDTLFYYRNESEPLYCLCLVTEVDGFPVMSSSIVIEEPLEVFNDTTDYVYYKGSRLTASSNGQLLLLDDNGSVVLEGKSYGPTS